MDHCISFIQANYEVLLIKEGIFINVLDLHIFDTLNTNFVKNMKLLLKLFKEF